VAPWPVGSRLSLNSRPLDAVGMNPFVLARPVAACRTQAGGQWDSGGFGAASSTAGARARWSGQRRAQAPWLLTVQGGQCWPNPAGNRRDCIRQMGLRGSLQSPDGGGSHWLDGRWGDDRVAAVESPPRISPMVLVWCHGMPSQTLPLHLSEARHVRSGLNRSPERRCPCLSMQARQAAVGRHTGAEHL